MNIRTPKMRALALVSAARTSHLVASATLTLAAIAGYGLGRSWVYEDWIASSLSGTDDNLDRLERLSAANADRLERLLEKAGDATRDVTQLQQRLAQAEAALELAGLDEESGAAHDD